ncbi:hypothetical protein [Salinicoccus roseus]|uniref:hypothetical protein n=1 Tax=Salinicoccus roseus TaxID=45670 RepID=UPI002301D249|nr:hypothetical protein [Salinicoccus roseus]
MARNKGLYAYYYGGELIIKGTVDEISEKLKVSERHVYYLMEKMPEETPFHPIIEEVEHVGEVVQIYDFYRDGHLVASGTKSELAELTNLSPATIRYYASQSSRKRIRNSRVVFNRTEERWR